MSTPNAQTGSDAPAPANTNQPSEEKQFTSAELSAAVENARKEEKQKLYADLEAARTQVSALTGEKSTLTQKLADLTKEVETLKTSSEIVSKAKTKTGEIDVQKLIEEATAAVAEQAKVTYGAQLAELSAQVSTLKGELQSKQVAETRARMIAEAGGEQALLPELVKGNNEEELRASIVESKRLFDIVRARVSSNTANPPATGTNGNGAPAPTNGAPATTNGAPAPIAPAPIIPSPSSAAPNAPLLQHLPSARRDPRAWAGERAERLKALEGRYKTSQ